MEPIRTIISRKLWLQVLSITLPVLHLLFGLLTKEFRFDLEGTKAQPYQGHAYAWTIPAPSLFWQAPTDSMQGPSSSTLRLYENGQPIGRPHTMHADLVSKPGGAYLHWNGRLYFTPRDNSDPRTNGAK